MYRNDDRERHEQIGRRANTTSVRGECDCHSSLAATRLAIDEEMTYLSPLIGELETRLELSDDARVQRRQTQQAAVRRANEISEELHAIVHDSAQWDPIWDMARQSDAATAAAQDLLGKVSHLHMSLRSWTVALADALKAVNSATAACQLAEDELINNATILVLRAVEGYLAHRPPEMVMATPLLGKRRIDVFAPPTTRVDLANPALGETSRNPGATLADGYGDPGYEDAEGIVRTRPLARTDLSDPTDAIHISDM